MAIILCFLEVIRGRTSTPSVLGPHVANVIRERVRSLPWAESTLTLWVKVELRIRAHWSTILFADFIRS